MAYSSTMVINERERKRGLMRERVYQSMREERREVYGRQKRVSRGAREIG